MPTYDYRCDACGHEHVHFQAMSEAPLRKCPKCGRMKLRRLIGSGAGIIFKGSGFYETDYKRSRSPSPSAEAGTKGEAAPKPEPKAGSKGEGKSEPKSKKKE